MVYEQADQKMGWSVMEGRPDIHAFRASAGTLGRGLHSNGVASQRRNGTSDFVSRLVDTGRDLL